MDITLKVASYDSDSSASNFDAVDVKEKKFGNHVTFCADGRDDSFSQAVSINILRNPEKGFVPIVPDSDQTRADLQNGKQSLVAELEANRDRVDQDVTEIATFMTTITTASSALQATMDSWSSQGAPSHPKALAQWESGMENMAAQSQDYAKKKSVAQDKLTTFTKKRQDLDNTLAAARATPILPPGKLPSNATVHLIGHGQANGQYLTTKQTGENPMHLDVVAKKLVTAGLSDDSRVKMGSCHSADIDVRQEFITAPNRPPRTETGILGLKKMAPAQRLSNALEKEGVENPKVTGYQGQGLRHSRVDGHQMQMLGDTKVRSSTVKREFDPYEPNVEKVWKSIV